MLFELEKNRKSNALDLLVTHFPERSAMFLVSDTQEKRHKKLRSLFEYDPVIGVILSASLKNSTKSKLTLFSNALFLSFIITFIFSTYAFSMQEIIIDNKTLEIIGGYNGYDGQPNELHIEGKKFRDFTSEHVSFGAIHQFKSGGTAIIIEESSMSGEFISILYYNGESFSFFDLEEYPKDGVISCRQNSDYIFLKEEDEFRCYFDPGKTYNSGYFLVKNDSLSIVYSDEFARDPKAISDAYNTYKNGFGMNWPDYPRSHYGFVKYLEGQRFSLETFSSICNYSKSTGKILSLKEFAEIMEGDTKALDKLIADAEHSSKDINAAEVSAADEREEDSFTPAVSDHSGKHYFTREEVQEILENGEPLSSLQELAMFLIDSLFVLGNAQKKNLIVSKTFNNIYFEEIYKDLQKDWFEFMHTYSLQGYGDDKYKFFQDILTYGVEENDIITFFENSKNSGNIKLCNEMLKMYGFRFKLPKNFTLSEKQIKDIFIKFVNDTVGTLEENLALRKKRFPIDDIFQRNEIVSIGELALLFPVSFSSEYLFNPPILKSDKINLFIWIGKLVHVNKQNNEIVHLNFNFNDKLFFAFDPIFIGDIRMNTDSIVFGFFETVTLDDGKFFPVLNEAIVSQ